MTHQRPTVLMANRVGDEFVRPIPGSVAGFAKCQHCNHDVTLAPSSVRALEANPEIIIVCVECGMAGLPDAGMEVTIVPGQIEELHAAGLEVAFPAGTQFRKPGT